MLWTIHFFKRVLNRCTALVAYTFVVSVLWASAFSSVEAQPSLGAILKDHLALGSGASIPLPAGQWQLTKIATIARTGYSWESMVLKNNSPEASIPFIVVRHVPTSVKWGNTSCTSDASNANHFMVNLHGTQASGLLNKCSRIFQLAKIGRAHV